MAIPHARFLELPPELTGIVLSYLDLESVHALEAVEYDREDDLTPLRRSIKDRQNPFIFYRKDFPHAEALFATMADTGSIAAGSRFLEYFSPGSQEDESDYNFFCQGDIDSISAMMRILEENGVQWKPLAEGLFELITFNAGREVTVSREIARTLKNSLVLLSQRLEAIIGPFNGNLYHHLGEPDEEHIKAVRAAQTSSNEIASLLRDALEETNDSRDSIKIKSDRHGIHRWEVVTALERPEPCPETLPDTNIITGTLRVGNSLRLVRLETNFGGLQFEGLGTFMHIARFYSTHSQCFLTGTHAIHAHRSTLTQNQGEIWRPTNWRQQKVYNELEKKHHNRGYNLGRKAHSSPLQHRHLGDSRSLVISFQDYYKPTQPIDTIDPALNEKNALEHREYFLYKDESIRTTLWYELRGFMVYHPKPLLEDFMDPLYDQERLLREMYPLFPLAWCGVEIHERVNYFPGPFIEV
ncbi:uncharacterized protein BDZ99DRAFT_517123 [Mytilinidion resinicola]|uniref:Uncharacterized protein n=1 Tax=Mytilinidion resinicola TaxID=574789 RepID=A0A6A6YWN7_9PEZI|nr:uncharacterized protein BDZ99DRAFT_517123 [Mytilinidion resinicola]KAF2812813.1 hypothetical protein BDZ99DRAFT_517123 [Mytilinidion resinicola]